MCVCHAGRDPFKLTKSGQGKCHKFMRFWMQKHLPKTGRKIEGREFSGIPPTNFINTFSNNFHGILVNIAIGIKSTKS